MKATTKESSGVRVCTAQEMRVRADYLEVALADAKTAAMLRQAADDMERETKYEYSVHPPEVNGVFQCRAGAELKALMLKHACNGDLTIVRREVGEWEEVKKCQGQT